MSKAPDQTPGTEATLVATHGDIQAALWDAWRQGYQSAVNTLRVVAKEMPDAQTAGVVMAAAEIVERAKP